MLDTVVVVGAAIITVGGVGAAMTMESFAVVDRSISSSSCLSSSIHHNTTDFLDVNDDNKRDVFNVGNGLPPRKGQGG